jgi:hypothetical protein
VYRNSEKYSFPSAAFQYLQSPEVRVERSYEPKEPASRLMLHLRVYPRVHA